MKVSSQPRQMTLRRGWLAQPIRLQADRAGISKIAEAVRLQRRALGESQRVVAMRAKVCIGTVSKLERFKTKSPHFRSVVDILNALGFDVTSHARREATKG